MHRNTTSKRSSLLGIVIAIHVGIALLLLTAKAVAPHIAEMPLVVELLQEPAAEPQAKPLPMAKPVPVVQKSTPKPSTPPIEASTTTQVSNNAPVATPVEAKANPAPPVAEAISQARFDADYLKNPAPPYPPLSRRAGEEGKVVLRVSVSPQGTAEHVEIKTSSGSTRLDEAAQKTVRTWKFIPAKRGDTPLQSFVLVPIIFKLEQ